MSAMSQWGDGLDEGQTPGTNRSAPIRDCQTCGGDRFVPIEQPVPEVADGRNGGYTEAYMGCPQCNPHDPKFKAKPIVDARWKDIA